MTQQSVGGCPGEARTGRSARSVWDWALLAFQLLLGVQGFVLASLVAQFCLQDELGLDVFTYRTSLFV